jgi:hypothetical protein
MLKGGRVSKVFSALNVSEAVKAEERWIKEYYV